MSQPEPRRPGKLEAVLSLASAAVVTWCMMPPQERYWIRLRVTAGLHRAVSRLAWREGHAGMADELAGRDLVRYPVAYRLSLARDRLGRALEEMRP